MWVGSTGGVVYRSADNGQTWSTSATGASGDITSGWAIDATHAVFAIRGIGEPDNEPKFYVTSNSGASWTSSIASRAAGEQFNSMTFSLNGKVGWASGASNTGYITSMDGGVTWSSLKSITGASDVMAPLSGGRAVFAGDNENISYMTPVATFPDGIAATGSGFGVCLESKSITATSTWSVKGVGNCLVSDLTAWKPIATNALGPSARVASTTGNVNNATVDLVFGVRIAKSQRAGDYVAPIILDVLAPDA